MNGSRIWIDLSSLCAGARKQSCVYVDHEEQKTVKDVEDHISRVFGLNRSIIILNDGWFLPSCESSRLLRDNDTVSVQEANEKLHLDSEKKNGEVNSNGNSTDAEHVNLVDNNRVTAKKTRTKTVQEDVFENMTVQVNTMKNPFATVNDNSHKLMRKVTVNSFGPSQQGESTTPPDLSSPQVPASPSTQQSSTVNSGHESSQDTEPKPKRVRRRKRKRKSDSEDVLEPKEVRQSPYIMNKYYQGVSHILNTSVAETNKKHIFFKEESDSNLYDGMEAPSKSIGNNNIESTNLSGIGMGGLPMNTSTRQESHSVPVLLKPINHSSVRPTELLGRTHVDGALSKLLSLSDQKSPVVFERKRADLTKPAVIKMNEPVNRSGSIKLCPLTDLPVKETVIRFKILKMVNYSPSVSEAITARVINVIREDERLFLQITEGLQELRPEKGKFSLDEDEETPMSEYTYLSWNELLEPKEVQFC